MALAAPLSPVTAPMLRLVAHEFKRVRSTGAFTDLITQFERDAHHLEVEADAPTIAIGDGLVTVTETCPLGKVLMVPAPACKETTIGTHVAAALTAGNQISLAMFAPMSGLAKLLCEVLTGALTAELFTVLSPGSGWQAPGRQAVVVVTPDSAFANDLPWRKQFSGPDDTDDVTELIRFYRRSPSFSIPFRTSPYRGYAS